MKRTEYLRKLQDEIRSQHGCASIHTSTMRVKTGLQGQVAWDGEVEVFGLSGHPKTKKCYAWGYEEGEKLKSTCVLEIHPVDSPSAAVDEALAALNRK